MNMNAGNNVTFTNGDTAVFEAGEIFFCEDVKGSGHKSQAYQGKSRYSVFVEVTETFDSGPCPNPNPEVSLVRSSDDILVVQNSLPLCKDVTAARFSLLEALSTM